MSNVALLFVTRLSESHSLQLVFIWSQTTSISHQHSLLADTIAFRMRQDQQPIVNDF